MLTDKWVPEGVNRHSQSVIDLFDFIRGSAKVILHDHPLGEYKRAIYLIDLSKVSPHDKRLRAIAESVDRLYRRHSVFLDGLCLVHCRSGTQGLDSDCGDPKPNPVPTGQQSR